MVPLQGETDTAREREALALAVQHDRIMTAEVWETPEDYPVPPDDTETIYVDLMAASPKGMPAGKIDTEPLELYRAGQRMFVHRYAISDNPAKVREATRDGYFAMTFREYELQAELQELWLKFEEATSEDRKELLAMKGAKITEQIDREVETGPEETILTIMEPWRAYKKQATLTWQRHVSNINSFVDFVGDIPLIDVTKRRVFEYMEHCQKQRRDDGRPYSPRTIAGRLESIKALLQFADDTDKIPFNPARGVKPPRDTRPRSAKSWKSFEPDEIKKLVTVATDLWTSRRPYRGCPETRRFDLITALHCLVWTGARPEEICQLRRADVDLTRQAIELINDETDDGARQRSLKNEHSYRTIPVHSRLLPVLKEHLRRVEGPLLFPSFEPKATKAEIRKAEETGQPVEIRSRYASVISQEWTSHLRERVTPGDRRKVLYSLRHSWAAESRRAGMPEHVRNAIMGHMDDNPVASRYGNDADWLDEKRSHLERMNCL